MFSNLDKSGSALKYSTMKLITNIDICLTILIQVFNNLELQNRSNTSDLRIKLEKKVNSKINKDAQVRQKSKSKNYERYSLISDTSDK